MKYSASSSYKAFSFEDFPFFHQIGKALANPPESPGSPGSSHNTAKLLTKSCHFMTVPSILQLHHVLLFLPDTNFPISY